MTADHLRMLRGVRGLVGPQPQLLSPDGEDVTDPIGWPQEVYEECAEPDLGDAAASVAADPGTLSGSP